MKGELMAVSQDSVRNKLEQDQGYFVVSKERTKSGVWSVQAFLKSSLLAPVIGKLPPWLSVRDDLVVSVVQEFATDVQAEQAEHQITQDVFELIDQAKVVHQRVRLYAEPHFVSWKSDGQVPEVEEEELESALLLQEDLKV